MTISPSLDPPELLQRHLPLLRYDSQEPYFADSAAEWTDNPGNVLGRANGTTIATAGGGSGETALSLGFLRPATYANGAAVSSQDRIGDPGRDYVAQAHALHAQPQYANRVYGHWATGSDERIWLAFWFFYFYNDYDLIGPLINAGLHEGDWEMIQLRLDQTGQIPDLAVYAQHRHAGQRPWAQVERVGDQPVVYPARGSHASYFTAGTHWTGDWFDHADGQRPAPPLTLQIISDDAGTDGWATWPGFWGDTQPPAGSVNPLDDSSPRGPGAHAQYRQPDILLQNATDHAAVLRPPPAATATAPAPTISVAAAADQDLRVSYDTHVDDPAGLVVTIGKPGDAGPPAIHRIPIDARTGVTTVRGAATGGPQTIRVSVATRDGTGSPATRTELGSP